MIRNADGIFRFKLPFFTFFAHDSGLRPKEAPRNMVLGMGIMAFFCIFFGLYPQSLYQLLPYPVAFDPFTVPHVVETLQLLLFASFAFFLLIVSGIYPPERNTISLDTDWPLRMVGGWFMRFIHGPLMSFSAWMDGNAKRIAADFSAFGEEKEEKVLVGISVMLALLFLTAYLLIEILYKWISG